MEIPGLEREIRVEVVALSDVGRRRSENQDAFLLRAFREGGDASTVLIGQGPSVTADPGVFQLGTRGAVVAVADGMGGAAEGALASRMALETFVDAMATRWQPERVATPQMFSEMLHRAVEDANASVHEASHAPGRHGMGTTLTAVGLLGPFAYVAQVGDSRAYLFRSGTLTQLTRDQSFVQEMLDAGQMTREDAENSPQRNVLLQALGVRPEVEVDLTFQDVRRGDVLLLCSDGLHGVVEDKSVEGELATDSDLQRAVAEMVESANRLGGPDNVTVVAVRLEGEGLLLPNDESEAPGV